MLLQIALQRRFTVGIHVITGLRHQANRCRCVTCNKQRSSWCNMLVFPPDGLESRVLKQLHGDKAVFLSAAAGE